MTHTLSKNEYYDVIFKNDSSHTPENDISKIPPLGIAVYNWVRDFSDRRGIRQTYESQLSEEDENDFLNETYQLLTKELQKTPEFNLDMIELLIKKLKRINRMSSEFDQIDDDIMEEIKETWLDIFQSALK